MAIQLSVAHLARKIASEQGIPLAEAQQKALRVVHKQANPALPVGAPSVRELALADRSRPLAEAQARAVRLAAANNPPAPVVHIADPIRARASQIARARGVDLATAQIMAVKERQREEQHQKETAQLRDWRAAQAKRHGR